MPGVGKKATWIFAILMALGLAACTPIIRNHGYVPFPEDLSEISVGVDTRETVIEKVGRPGAGGVLEDRGFYYVGYRIQQFGPFKPREIDRKVLAITFSSSGVVRNIVLYGLEDGRVVALNKRVTDGVFEERTFLRQLLGNIGRVGPGIAPGAVDG